VSQPGPVSPDASAPAPHAVGPLLRRAHARAARAFSEGLAPLGIEGRHFGVMAALVDGPRTQRDLVDDVGTDRVSMMRIVDDLEARELARRRAVPGDRRLRAVELTDHGRAVVHEAEGTARSTGEALLAHLDPDERSTLIALLGRFVSPERPADPSPGRRG
jgi:MarR family transcriptional regulator, lower aerobic nicotinate degradation pathway regulator